MIGVLGLLGLLLPQGAPQDAGGAALTIYNQGFAVVRQRVPLELTAGVNRLSYSEITAQLEPDSVILRDPTGRVTLQVLEQSYRADPVSEGLLLSLFEGQTIPFLQGDGKTLEGRIVRSGYVPVWTQQNYYGRGGGGAQPIIEVDGALRFGLPGLPLFPALGDDTVLEPTLDWVLRADQAGAVDAELGYVTSGFGWEADYNLVAPPAGDVVDLVGWITMQNQSGRTFEEARIKLLAGEVNKVQQPQAAKALRSLGYVSEAAPAVTEKAFDDFHLYTLARRTTLRDSETKQVEFVRASRVAAERFYVYDGAYVDMNQYRGWDMENIRGNKDYGTKSNPKVWILRSIPNTAENGLGMALPKGRLRFYRQDDDGQLEFTGENEIMHTPKDETIEVYTGDAFDIVGERVRTQYNVDSRGNSMDEAFRIELRNHKQEPVEVRVVEHLYRWSNWELQKPTTPWTRTDSQTIEFRVTVPADGAAEVRYGVHYSW